MADSPPRTPIDASRAFAPGALDDATTRLIRERDDLFLLHEALGEVERAATLEERLRIFVEAIQRIGYGRVTITLRDDALEPTLIVTAGMTAEEDRELRVNAASGEVWRRRLARMERFRISASYYADSRDPWVAAEFGDALRSHLDEADGSGWSPRDFLLVPLKGTRGQVIGTLVLDDPSDRSAPTLARVRTVELFAQQVAALIEHARLVHLAERRAERLQLLQEAGRALAGSLDEQEVARELARQVERLVDCSEVAIVLCGEKGECRTVVRRVGGVETPPRQSAHCEGLVREVRLAGTPVRFDARELRGPGESEGASMLGVPVQSASTLKAVIAVWSRRTDAFAAEDLEALLTVAAHAASALGNARRYAESMHERSRSEALADIARAVSSSLRLDDVMALILRHAVALLRVEGAGLGLTHEGDDGIHIVAAVGAAEPLIGVRMPRQGTVAGRALEQRAPAICNDPFADPDAYAPTRDAVGIRSILIVPLYGNAGAIGVIAVINRATPFTDEDASVLQRLADHVAVAVVNARLFEEHHTLGERYRRVLETTSDAIVIVGADRRITFTNPAADTLLGVAGTPLGLSGATFIPPELHDRVAAHESRTLAGEAQHYESVLLRADGERRFVSVSTAPLRDGAQVVGIVASMRDVTDERRARDAVAQSEARYRNLFESATDAIYTVDATGCFTSVNAATCAIAGLSRDRLLGRSCLPLLDPSEVTRVTQHFKSALAGVPRHYECHYVRPDGEQRLVSVTNTPIRHGSQVVGVLGVARDVTDERARAAALARSEARYTRLVESASDAIFVVDTEGVLTSVNHSLERGVGRTRADLLGAPFVDLIDARDQALCAELLRQTLSGERRRAELRYPSAAGEVRDCSIMATPIVEDGLVTGALGIVRDVTDEKRLTEQLMQQEKLAAVGQLVSGVAHELNNPLAGVMAFSQLLLASPAAQPEQLRAVEAIHQEAKRAAKIVSNLLTFARQHQPERQITDLNRVVNDTVELRRYGLRVNQVEVELRLDPLLPLTWADPFQLQQVVLNLLTNAEQALADWAGPRRIDISTSRTGETLCVTVADSGPGIPAEDLSRLFNPFFTTKPVGEGTGLGLSISDGIVREHEGRIRVESRPGEGATFVIELPRVLPPVPDAPNDDVGSTPQPPVGRYLVVDDEPAIRAAIASYLRSLGHGVDTAAGGREALDWLAHHHYDGVVLDLRMPDLPGDAVFVEIRQREPALAGRVVFLTGDMQSDSARRFLEETGRPVVTKPFLLDDLAAVLLVETQS